MKTSLKARNLDLTDGLRARIERKLRRLDRVAHDQAEADVELIANASRASDSANVAEITMRNNGTVLRSTASGATPLAALDLVLDKLERQMVRTKTKPRRIRERDHDVVERVLHREALGTIEPGSYNEPPEDGAAVVKVKRFDMIPMFEEDAITQMEELGHAFFVFLNAETDAIAVVYRRREGNYGLIEPVLDSNGSRR